MEPYIGQIELLPYTFAPMNWLACNGQILAISEYETLYTLIGTTYGGDGQSTFALPNLNARVAIGSGNGKGLSPIALGQVGGAEDAVLSINTMPAHSHDFHASPNAASDSPVQQLPSSTIDSAGADVQMYGTAPNGTMALNTVTSVGSGQHFPIRNPYLGMLYCIATVGVFPQFS